MAIPYATSAFVDTSAYFALANENEAFHSAAAAIAARLAEARTRLFTTDYIVAGTHAIVLRKIGLDAAARVLKELDSGSTVVVRVDEADEHRARWILARYDDKDFSLTDATSFAVMERLDISSAFTFDRQFAQYGFSVVAA
ncbi:MAG: type II toxin-antitoxin system VapC family toxin [Thermomicrobiales bacterium]